MPADLRFWPWPKTSTVEYLAEIVAARGRVQFPLEIRVRRSEAGRIYVPQPPKDHVAILRERRNPHGIKPLASDALLSNDRVQRGSGADVLELPSDVAVVFENENWLAV